ncbi:hypothetical protein AJ80_05737 [Polytolypa hystricis UAMH7299]|uniref:DNA recombination and repair protein Rad51-like C-terminal domain-containing protein n=1 Tax=Polytolypa hystricis (strain UAMH7299) TaxID=1447883 RepID=A0A2B7XT86_POLH7|nr:hypothetical protein AJ80_05737 [Polytolypa hystricis UAMH7299]
MSAEQGARLLSEIEGRNLAEILRDVRAINNAAQSNDDTESNACRLGVKPLDDLLRIFQSPPALGHTQHVAARTAAALPAASVQADNAPPSTPSIRHGTKTTPTRPPVLEITSSASGNGATSLLYYITALAILPPSFDGITLDGKNSAVVFLDTDYRFDAVRLHDVAMGIVRDKASAQHVPLPYYHHDDDGQGPDQLEPMLHEALRHVHIFRPQSSHALLAAIKAIPSYLLHSTDHPSSHRALHAILLDSASAFYWQDRREADVLRIPGVREERERTARTTDTGTGDPSTTKEEDEEINITQVPRETIASLRHLQTIFDCAIVYTTWGLQRAWPSSSSSSSTSPYSYQSPPGGIPSFRPHLPFPWPAFATCRVVVQRDPVRPFAPQMTLKEAMEEAGMRQGVVAKGRVSGWLDLRGREEWGYGVEERVRRLDGRGAFRFYVTERGVTFGGDDMV